MKTTVRPKVVWLVAWDLFREALAAAGLAVGLAVTVVWPFLVFGEDQQGALIESGWLVLLVVIAAVVAVFRSTAE